MANPRILMYTGARCAYCNAAKQLLQRLGLAHEEIDLSADPEKRMELIAETGWRTVPMIFVDGELIGGFEDLRALSEGGGLDALKAQGEVD